jgi:hypothetical protein
VSGLVKTRTLLYFADIDTEDGDFVLFDRDVEEEDLDDLGVAISGDLWLRFGQPDVLTVTIEPGDTLN